MLQKRIYFSCLRTLAFLSVFIFVDCGGSGISNRIPIQANDCSQADVANAIGNASKKIGSSSNRFKMVTLVGGRTGLTQITCNTTCIEVWSSSSLSSFQVSRIRSAGEPWAIQLSGHADDYDSLFRIHNNYFQYANGSTDNAIFLWGLNTYSTPDNGQPYIWGLIR